MRLGRGVLGRGALGCGLLSWGLALGACESLPVDPSLGPNLLSQTGLYADPAAHRLKEGLIALEPRFPLWSDAAHKRRFLELPAGAQIDSSVAEAWRFPVGTRVWKEFSFDGALVETRLLEKRREPDDGGWFQMAYAWRDDESDAEAVPDGRKGARGLPYDIPGQRDCGACHYRGEHPVIGVSALQLLGPLGSEAPSMRALIAAGALSSTPPPAYDPPGDPTVQAALGYLHGNCGHCHDSRSAAATDVKVWMELHLDDTVAEQTQTYRSLVGQPIHHFPEVGLKALVAPGDPEHSLVTYRMARRDLAQMPPIATRLVDAEGLARIEAWIRALPPTP